MTRQHARMLAEQDSYGARNVEARKQHTKNQRRECMAWKQRTHNARRQSDGQARWQQSHWARTVKHNAKQANVKSVQTQPVPRGMRRPSRAVPLAQA